MWDPPGPPSLSWSLRSETAHFREVRSWLCSLVLSFLLCLMLPVFYIGLIPRIRGQRLERPETEQFPNDPGEGQK